MDYKRYGSICANNNEELIPIYSKPKREYKGNTVLGMKTTSYFFCMFILLYIIFVCSGAALFSFFEAPEEMALKVRVTGVIENFLNSHPTVTG